MEGAVASWKWVPLEPQTGQKSFILSCLRWWCRGASKPGRAKALEGEKLPDSPPINYGIHPKLESIQIIMSNNMILPQNQVPGGNEEQTRKGTQGTKPKADSASEPKRLTSRLLGPLSCWDSVKLSRAR